MPLVEYVIKEIRVMLKKKQEWLPIHYQSI